MARCFRRPRPSPVILSVIPPRRTSKTRSHQMDVITDLTCKDGTAHHLVDGWDRLIIAWSSDTWPTMRSSTPSTILRPHEQDRRGCRPLGRRPLNCRWSPRGPRLLGRQPARHGHPRPLLHRAAPARSKCQHCYRRMRNGTSRPKRNRPLRETIGSSRRPSAPEHNGSSPRLGASVTGGSSRIRGREHEPIVTPA